MASHDEEQIRIITLSENRLRCIIQESVRIALDKYTKKEWADDDAWLSARRAAKLVGTRRSNVDLAIKNMELQACEINGNKRVRAKDVRAWYGKGET